MGLIYFSMHFTLGKKNDIMINEFVLCKERLNFLKMVASTICFSMIKVLVGEFQTFMPLL